MAVVEAQNNKGVKAAEVQLFREDVVQSVAHPSLVGMVSKVGGDSSDSSSSSESDNSDDEADDESQEVVKGCARVCWINADESTEKIADIRVLDRAFLHGDVVAAAADPLGQTGTVVNVDMHVDLEFPNGEVVTKVNSRKLQRVRAFMPGDYVIHNQWLGRVDEVVDHVTVLFDDGAKCKVMRADPERLVPVLETAVGDSGCPYYPGLRVRSTSSSLFKGARWLRGSWKASRMEGVVADVEAGSVLVYWIAAGNAWENSQSFIPAEQQDPKGLVPLTYFSYTNWQVGDRSLPPKGLRGGNAAEVGPSDGDLDLGFENELHGSVAEGQTASECLGSNNAGALIGELQQDSWTGHRRKSRRCSVKREKRKSKKKDEAVENAVLIVNTKTSVDVIWQDGTKSLNISACSLIPVDHLGDHDFWPEQYVLERGSDGEGIDTQVRRVGIAKSVDSKQRIATVKWLKPVQRPEEPREFEAEEIVSVYELIEHPDYNYCLADVVIRLSLAPDSVTHIAKKLLDDSEGGSSAAEDNSDQEGDDNEADLLGKERTPKSRDQERNKLRSGPQDLSWVGVITGLEDGDIEVVWANGMVSKVGPQAIFVVSRDDDESSTLTTDVEEIAGDDVDDAASWETVDSTAENDLDQDDQLDQTSWVPAIPQDPSSADSELKCEQESRVIRESSQGRKDLLVSKVKEELLEKRPAQFGPLTFVLAAIGFLSRFAGFLLGLRGTKRILDVGLQSTTGSQGTILNNQGEVIGVGAAEKVSENLQEATIHHPSSQQFQNDAEASWQAEHHIDESINVETQNQKENDTFGSGSSDLKSKPEGADLKFKHQDNDNSITENSDMQEPICGSMVHFDIVKDPQDHHYFGEAGQASSQRKWVKKVQQEWAVLEKNLPDTIFVRVYEERMDLLRALIVGAAGTPYHDGLFVFDLYLPPEYPSVPPVVYYHSGGLRLNPNLYENGKVCLSLLNTWAGKGPEVWSPASSSILQVLVSIQGLVLNSKPYFNEAGYDRQVGTAEGEKNSIVYNENSFLLSCKSMLYLLHRPPKHLEELIQNHFKSRGPHILSACNAYLSGALVGSFADAVTTPSSAGNDLHKSSSEGFKLMLAKLVPRLAAAFGETGAV